MSQVTSIEDMNREFWTLFQPSDSKATPRACIGRKQAFDRAIQELGEPMLEGSRAIAVQYIEGTAKGCCAGDTVYLESNHKTVKLQRWLGPSESGW